MLAKSINIGIIPQYIQTELNTNKENCRKYNWIMDNKRSLANCINKIGLHNLSCYRDMGGDELLNDKGHPGPNG